MTSIRFLTALVGLLIAQAPGALADAGRASPQEVVARVQQAAYLLESKGVVALTELSRPSSRFVWKDTYVFVVNCAADKVMANPAYPERVGGDIKQHTDYAGKRYGPELCATAARPGGGWIEYVWLPPGADKAVRKVSYVMSVAGMPYQVGAGVHDETIGLDALHELIAANGQ